MIIIVEGIDRVGKSTLCKKLSEETGYNIFRDDFRYTKEYKDKNINDEKGNTFINLVEQGIVKDAILDRFHWSDIVYGYLERHQDAAKDRDMELRLRKCKTKVVIILVRPTDVVESSRQHGKDLSRHAKMFDELYCKSEMESYAMKYCDIPYMVEKIKEIIENEKCTNSINNEV